jgi:dTDP-glucose 4,6-dehydratase
MSKTKILVTGSTGFIFSNFIRKALYWQSQNKSLNYDFVSIDKVSGNLATSIYSNKDHKFYMADIRDQHIINNIFQFEKPDVIIHGAAMTSVDGGMNAPTEYVSSNVLGTQVLLNAATKYGVKKFIYISTDEVYGQLKSESELSWTEEAPFNSRNSYSASKASGELLVRAMAEAHGITYNITRSANNYGPRQTPDKLIPRVIKCILNNEKIPVYGQGQQIRDWLHVYDNCVGILTVLEKGLANQTYNIAANQEFSNIEVIHEICKYMGKGTELIEFIKDPRGNSHDFRYSMDASKLKALGWKPEMQFKKSIGNECIDWFVNNKWYFNQKQGV